MAAGRSFKFDIKKKTISGSSDAKKKLQQSHSVVDYQTEFTFGEMFQELFDLASKTWKLAYATNVHNTVGSEYQTSPV